MKPNPTRIAIGAILVCALTLGTYSAFSVYMMAISEKVSADLSRVALIFTMCSICGLVVNLFLGNFIKMFGIRKLIIINGLAVIIFFLTIAFSISLVPILLGAFIFGLVNGGFGVCQTELSVWFTKGQGTLISLLSVGMGIVAMIISPILSKLLMVHGLSSVALIHGLVVGIIVIMLGLFFMAEPPAAYGMEPVGYEPSASEAVSNAGSALSIGEIIRFPAFWCIVIAGCLFNFVNGAFTSNGAVIYQSLGADAVQASLCISIYSLVLMGFSPIFGIVSDKKGVSIGVMIIGGAAIIGAIAAISLTGMTGAIITAVFMSASAVCGSVAPISLVKTFGPANAGNLIGYAMVFGSIGQMTAAPISARIYVATGSFRIFLMISIVLAIIVILLITTATSRKTVEKINSAAN